MKTRNRTTYRATLSQMRMHAFGMEQVLDYTETIEIYQARVSPELWRARPTFSHGNHNWEAASADALMEIITADFEQVYRPWKAWEWDAQMIRRPSLVKSPETGVKSA